MRRILVPHSCLVFISMVFGWIYLTRSLPIYHHLSPPPHLLLHQVPFPPLRVPPPLPPAGASAGLAPLNWRASDLRSSLEQCSAWRIEAAVPGLSVTLSEVTNAGAWNNYLEKRNWFIQMQRRVIYLAAIRNDRTNPNHCNIRLEPVQFVKHKCQCIKRMQSIVNDKLNSWRIERSNC